MKFAASLVAALALVAGCSTVEPYQRAWLARPDMGFEVMVGTAKALDKTYPAKEAASGGGSVGGGGCGCN